VTGRLSHLTRVRITEMRRARRARAVAARATATATARAWHRRRSAAGKTVAGPRVKGACLAMASSRCFFFFFFLSPSSFSFIDFATLVHCCPGLHCRRLHVLAAVDLMFLYQKGSRGANVES
jgi:hypothetical protein